MKSSSSRMQEAGNNASTPTHAVSCASLRAKTEQPPGFFVVDPLTKLYRDMDESIEDLAEEGQRDDHPWGAEIVVDLCEDVECIGDDRDRIALPIDGGEGGSCRIPRSRRLEGGQGSMTVRTNPQGFQHPTKSRLTTMFGSGPTKDGGQGGPQ